MPEPTTPAQFDLASRLDVAINKLGKWRTFFAGWQLGTRALSDGTARAVRDHRDLSMMLRVEVSTLAMLLIRKGVFTLEEYNEELIRQAKTLDATYERQFPGFSTSDAGLHLQLPEALETQVRLGFPP